MNPAHNTSCCSTYGEPERADWFQRIGWASVALGMAWCVWQAVMP